MKQRAYILITLLLALYCGGRTDAFFNNTGSLSAGRSFHAAALLSIGKVLVSGGSCLSTAAI
jgi:hypothetical protein